MPLCPDCKADFSNSSGPRHRYFGASAGCWASYGEVLAKEYSDPAWFIHHRFTVDAYALQHPGTENPQTVQSVNIHLLATSLMFSKGLTAAQTTAAMRVASLKSKAEPKLFRWLPPPADLGDITVRDIRPITDLETHLIAVKNWAQSVWQKWESHHPAMETLIEQLHLEIFLKRQNSESRTP